MRARPNRIVVISSGALLTLVVSCAPPPTTNSADLGAGMSEAQGKRIENAFKDAKRGFKAEDPQKQEDYYSSAVRQYREFGAAWNNLGVSLMAQDRFVEADEAFARASELSPEDPRPPYNRGLLLHRRGYVEKSLPHFRESLDRDPRYLNAIRSLTVSQIRLGRSDEETLELVERGQMLDTDEQWREYFARQRLRIEASLNVSAAP